MGNFREYVAKISPPWLRRYYGERFVGFTIGLMTDLVSEGAAQALKASWLHSDTSPPDALPEIGLERSMPRYTADTDATYRDRLHKAWDAWLFAGNEEGTGGLGIIGQYNAMGLANVVILPAENYDPRAARPSWRFEAYPTIAMWGDITFHNDYLGTGKSAMLHTTLDWSDYGFAAGMSAYVIGSSLNDNNTGYNVIGAIGKALYIRGTVLVDEAPPPMGCLVDGTNWSRFAVVIEEGHGWIPWVYGDGHVYGSADDSPTYGSTATIGEVRTVKAIARKWGPGHAINPYIYVVLSGDYYGDPDLVYGDPALVTLYGIGSIIKWPHQV